jgi:hypothetical protein
MADNWSYILGAIFSNSSKIKNCYLLIELIVRYNSCHSTSNYSIRLCSHLGTCLMKSYNSMKISKRPKNERPINSPKVPPITANLSGNVTRAE